METLIDEIMPVMYGKDAAPSMKQYFRVLHDFIRHATSQAAEKESRQYFDGGMQRLKIVPETYFKTCYALLTQAENAAKNNPEYLPRIHLEKCRLLFAEINSRNMATVQMDEAALAAYSARLAELVQLASERANNLPFAFYNVPFPKWLRQITEGKVEFGGGAYGWNRDPKVKEFLKNPLAALKVEKRVQTAIRGGWEVPAGAFFGGDYVENYEGRPVSVARRAGSEKSRLHAGLYLDAIPVGNYETRLVGMDNDKKEKAKIRIAINGREIYSGPVAFEKHWSEMTCKIPAGVLKKGENTIVIENITPGAVNPDGAAGPLEETMNKSYNWGWFIIGTAKIIAAVK